MTQFVRMESQKCYSEKSALHIRSALFFYRLNVLPLRLAWDMPIRRHILVLITHNEVDAIVVDGDEATAVEVADGAFVDFLADCELLHDVGSIAFVA